MILECSGNVTLSVYDSALNKHHTVTIHHTDPEILQSQRKRRSVLTKHPDGSGKYLQFKVVTHSGNCDWKLWSKARGGGGKSYFMTFPETKTSIWAIKSVQLKD